MSARPGTIGNLIIASAVLGQNAGRIISLNNGSLALIDAIVLSFVATATVGNRTLVLLIKDSVGNLLWECILTTAITASQTVLIEAGAGVAAQQFTTPILAQLVPLPSELAIPAQSTITVQDIAHIDNNDTVSGTVSLAL